MNATAQQGYVLTLPAAPFTEINYFMRPKHWEYAAHRHDYLQFLVVIGGTLRLTVQNEETLLFPGDASLIPAGFTHSLQTDGGYAQLGANLHLDRPEFLLGIPALLRSRITAPAITRCEQLFQQSGGLIQMLRQGSAMDHAWIYLSMLSGLLEAMEGLEHRDQRQFALQLSDYLEHHLADHVSVRQVADHFHLSVSQVERLCRQCFGAGVIALYQQKRLAHAQVLLLNSPLSIKAIGESIGFDDASNFSAFFSRHTGMPPSACKKQKQ